MLNRRKFLGGMGLSFMLPNLEALGNVKSDVKRFAAVYVPNGINMHHWTPDYQGDLIDLPGTLSPMQDHINNMHILSGLTHDKACLLYTSPSPRDGLLSRMPSTA